MKVMKCPMCGAPLNIDESQASCVCEYCLSHISTKGLDDEKIATLKERATKLFLECDFDAAASLYQSIVTEDPNDAEAYWLLALCTYGIQYVDDPKEGIRIPTCHRTVYTSILHNDDYLNALDCASDLLTREAYEKAAVRIDQIQKGILNIVEKETPYDVFICYKESDENGHRTKESDIAKDLYYKLTSEGYRTFYAPITLQEKAGMEFEPYIFAALNTSRIMLAIGFSAEHFNAVWVKNEWSRFLARKAKNPRLMLICCYNSFLMNASDIPEELSKTQARDLANASSNDLVADIKKLIPKEKATSTQTVQPVDFNNFMGSNASALLKRGYIYLEDREFAEAMASFDKSLDMNPELSKAYWGVLLAKKHCRNSDELAALGEPITDFNEYRKAVRFANTSEQDEYQDVVNAINNKITHTIRSLHLSRRARIDRMAVAALLKDTADLVTKAQKEYNDFLNRKAELEKNITECINACKADISHCQKTIKENEGAIVRMIAECKKYSMISDTDKATWISKIRECEKLSGEAKEEAVKISNNSENFKRLKSLKSEYANAVKAIENLNYTMVRRNQELKEKNSAINAVEAHYKEAFQNVPKGKYEEAKRILS